MLSSIPFQSCLVILNAIEFAVILGIEDGFMTSLENNGLKVVFHFKNSQRTAALSHLTPISSSSLVLLHTLFKQAITEENIPFDLLLPATLLLQRVVPWPYFLISLMESL